MQNNLNRIMVWDNTTKNITDLKINILQEYEKRKYDLVEHHTGYRMVMDKSMPSTSDLDNIFNPYLEEYIEKFNLDKKEYHFSEWILIGWTVPGRGMELHNDHIQDVSLELIDHPHPMLTAIFYLAHSCEGGNLVFPDLNLEITPKDGTLVIFPSEEMHEVLEYISGERIVIQKFVFKP